jgi:hypothetical protein
MCKPIRLESLRSAYPNFLATKIAMMSFLQIVPQTKEARLGWGSYFFPKQRRHDWAGVLTWFVENYLCIPGFAVVAYLPRLA